ncbi:hypothetical protein JOQ06_011928 [Pogonophryne albipinna]|uniref:Uncharacterized protein n=1 Tax=Pogonophryne albipinna TaxID=1090488 RepID=A0AAD6BC94_9TELE|nr:hypothetical protein JOQ06_011928 [Pogonophryne albipinna]
METGGSQTELLEGILTLSFITANNETVVFIGKSGFPQRIQAPYRRLPTVQSKFVCCTVKKYTGYLSFLTPEFWDL